MSSAGARKPDIIGDDARNEKGTFHARHARHARGSASILSRVARVSWMLASIAGLFPLGAQSSRYTFLGDVRDVSRSDLGVLIRAQHGSVMFESAADVGVRVRIRFGDSAATFTVPRSLATGDSAVRIVPASLRESGDTIVIGGAAQIEILVTRHPLRIIARDSAGHELLRDSYGAGVSGGRIVHYVQDPKGARYFGLGEQPTKLVRNGSAFPFWNTDRFDYKPLEMPIYSSMPFYIGVTNGIAHGVLYDNPFRGEMDLANRLPVSIGYDAEGAPDGGELRYYIIAGPGIDRVLERFSRLTGRMPLPPRWALGYQQSRYSYTPDTMVLDVAREMRRRDIPADALYLDIGYMNGYRVFTWSPTDFRAPKAMLDTLGTMGFKVVAIVDPGVKVDSAYEMYRRGLEHHAFLTTPDGAPALGTVWPGISTFPDFSRAAVRDWWGKAQSALIDPGVRGIWNDMNEPASFTGGTLSELVQFDGDGHPGGHVEYHNQYGTLMARASFDGLHALRPQLRPFVITRAAYTGVQRYSSVWTGDNGSTWDHLRLSLPMVISLGLSGEPFAGSDIGGFTGKPSGELYARWLQAAALVPLFRTHSSIDVPRREPWSFGAEYERVNRATIRLRYRLLPAVYAAFHQHVESGAPAVRPIFWNELSDTVALATDDEFLLGDHLLAAPVVDSATDSRTVYLPRGRWYRIGSDSAYDGGARVTVSAPGVQSDGGDTTGLRGLPLFARAGAVIPMQRVMLYDGARALDTLELHVWAGASSPVTSALYEDAGDGYGYTRGDFRATTITTSTSATGAMTIAMAREGSYAGARAYVVTLHALGRVRSVRVNGRALTMRSDAATRTTSFVIGATAKRITIVP
ncbi:MAG TPA: TIM-barrel domain-containing protein [Gemmatimonadaceae bacterium]|nr:TIM-barrel domain-containing protein [Gemmatimonadaceae bacterium]